jgi:hypothetical protein
MQDFIVLICFVLALVLLLILSTRMAPDERGPLDPWTPWPG